MGRPRYETCEDLASERAVAAHIASHKGISFSKLSPMLYGIDWAFWEPVGRIPGSHGHVRFLAEVKCRKTDHDTFPHYMISLEKMAKIKQTRARFDIPSLLAVSFRDGIYVATDQCSYTIGMGKRAPQRDEYDEEPMAFIPAKEFTFVP